MRMAWTSAMREQQEWSRTRRVLDDGLEGLEVLVGCVLEGGVLERARRHSVNRVVATVASGEVTD